MVPKPGHSLLVSILALLLVSPVRLQSFELTPQGPRAVALLPSTPMTPPSFEDLNNDDRPESLLLMDGRLSILSGSETAWQSPPAWQVSQADFTDLNRDGSPEVTLLVWRPFAPWPVDRWLPHGGRINEFHDSEDQSCHLILIGWGEGKYRELWAGSALAEPVLDFAAVDLDGDGDQELLTLDGSYDDPPSEPASAFKTWEWNGFGFTVVYSLAGNFVHMQPVQSTTDGHIQLILQTLPTLERSNP